MRVAHLQHFAFAQTVGGVGERLHDFEVARAYHHLKRAGIEKVAHKDGRAVTPTSIGRFTAASHFALVDDIVVHERGRVKNFNDGTEIGGFGGVGSHGAGHQDE